MAVRGSLFALVAGLMVAAAAHSPSTAQPAPPLAGKTITFIVGVQPGGTSDTFVRTLMPYLKKHTPGQPNILVQFMPGAGGVLATNHLFEVAKPDGQTIEFGPWDPLAQALGNQGLRARYEKLEYIGGFGDTRILYARSDVVPGGLKRPVDIVKAPFINLGSFNSTDASALMANLALEVLGIKHKVITGYRGGNDILLAVQRGEVQFHSTSVGTLRRSGAELIKNGTLVEIGYLVGVDANGKYEPNPNIKEMPAFPDVVKEALGKLPTGANWDTLNWLVTLFGQMTFTTFAPPKTPPAVLADLRQGFAAAMTDPEFVEKSIKVNGLPYDSVSPEKAQKIIKLLSEVSPEVLATVRASVEALGR